MLLRSVLVWLALMLIAIANGGARELLLAPKLGSKVGHVVSTLMLCGAIVLIAWLTVPWIGAGRMADGWKIGVMWLVLTLAFEFLAGHYLFGSSWGKLLADYNLAKGRIWLVVPIVTLLAPAWASSLLRSKA